MATSAEEASLALLAQRGHHHVDGMADLDGRLHTP